MNPFEELIRQLSVLMGIPLQADNHQSCLITFREEEVAIQIDLDTQADRILVGSQLGRITPGIYRERIFIEALKSNGNCRNPQGILAFSEKNDSLILYQFLNLAHLTGEKLHPFITIFREQAVLWKGAIQKGEIPQILIETPRGSGMYGL